MLLFELLGSEGMRQFGNKPAAACMDDDMLSFGAAVHAASSTAASVGAVNVLCKARVGRARHKAVNRALVLGKSMKKEMWHVLRVAKRGIMQQWIVPS